MKIKDNKTVFHVIIRVFLVAVLILTGTLLEEKINNVPVENLNTKDKTTLELLSQNNTLGEIIYKTSQEERKGPGATSEKVAYITIDDGPSKYTNALLDILKENDVKATFFMLNQNMKKHKEEVKRVLEEQNSIGFHSVSHDIHKLYKSPEVTVGEFDTCNKTLQDITGQSSKLIRLPYGSKPYMPEGSYDKLMANNYLIWDWNLDTQDWKSSTSQIVSNILYYGRKRDELVVLIHEKEQSVNALNNMIRILKERGYTILPITENVMPKNFWQENL
ncbi:polysaccharide deacetylase family protein [Clostridioides sp. ES-S-0190-01]|uniref:polysaccharide deacetylase family protein n=1 Tax=Clostridioides sp. ES-S-0190-01 TaxID=2770787 RepID=UPI001D116D86|nr:polysaccharide deacetylase [Clostridioides sp. ES-S-0190-01]